MKPVPPPQLPSSPSILLARQVQLAIIALGFFILLITLSAITLVRWVTGTQESLADTLPSQARTIAEPPRGYFWFLPSLYDPKTGEVEEEPLAYYSGLPDWQELALSLAGTRSNPTIADVSVLTPSGEVIMESSGSPSSEEGRTRFKDRDAVWIAKAAAGAPATPVLSINDLDKRLYYPIRNEKAELVAILRLEIDQGYFNAMRKRGRWLLVGFVSSNAILVALYLLTMRLVKRTIQAERQVSQADRLRALGTMTAGIAHEIRNPLGIISLQVEELRAFIKGIRDDALRASFEQVASEIQQETRRLRDLTETFLQFSRANSSVTLRTVAVRVDTIVPATVKLWSKGLNPQSRRVEVRNEAGEASALFTEDRMRQVLLNLLRNADEALGSRQGTIEVVIARQGANIEIAVKDDGPGISRANLEQIFDPFFTTRAEGTGLGLPLSRALARSAGGDLVVETEEGKGATFTLRLAAS